MTVTEFYKSREVNITQEGETLTAIWDATWTDWDNDYYNLPIIGDYWPGRYDLRCTDIRTRTIDNVNCEVTALFSTLGYENRREKANQIDSWEASIDVNTEEIYADTYFDKISNAQKSWVTAWSDAGGSDATRPYHIFYKPKSVLQITTYGKINYMYRIYANVGKINAGEIVREYHAAKTEANPQYNDDVSTSADSGMWMLQGCRTAHIRADTWRYDWSFVFNPIGWQYEQGPDGSDIATNEYDTFTFIGDNGIFTGMDFIEPEFDRGT